jgi:hypothetical protein
MAEVSQIAGSLWSMQNTVQYDELLLLAFALKMFCHNSVLKIILLHMVQPRFSWLNTTDTTVMSTRIHLQCKVPA